MDPGNVADLGMFAEGRPTDGYCIPVVTIGLVLGCPPKTGKTCRMNVVLRFESDLIYIALPKSPTRRPRHFPHSFLFRTFSAFLAPLTSKACSAYMNGRIVDDYFYNDVNTTYSESLWLHSLYRTNDAVSET